MKLIEAEKISKVFTDGSQRITALEKTNFSVEASELVAVIGPSGSGKSTLLTILGGLQQPSEGKVLINGNKLGGFAMTEDHSGSDLSYLETTAWETENGWTINGSKKYVSNAAKADLFLVVAKANKLNGETGIGIFIVKRSNEGLNISDTMD